MFSSQSNHTSRPEQAFTVDGFRDWKHAMGSKGILTTHNNCLSHKESMITWQHFKLAKKTGSVADQLLTLRSEQIKKNNQYMISVCDVLRLCCKQEIALRGHDESSESSKRGNFLELMSLLTRYNPIVHDRLLNGPQNAKYTSPVIQNIMIGIMASQIRQSIGSSIQKAAYFSIMVDETKDLSKQEQLSVILHYVDPESTVASIQKRFLTFFPASNFNAESLSQYIKTILEQFS